MGIDRVGPDLPREARELFYGGSQPATLFETYPSAHALLRVTIEILTTHHLRSPWFRELVNNEHTCLLWGNVVQTKDGKPLYDIETLGELVAYSPAHMIGWPACDTCGRLNGAASAQPCMHCGVAGRAKGSEFCSPGHATLYQVNMARAKKEREAAVQESIEPSGLITL